MLEKTSCLNHQQYKLHSRVFCFLLFVLVQCCYPFDFVHQIISAAFLKDKVVVTCCDLFLEHFARQGDDIGLEEYNLW